MNDKFNKTDILIDLTSLLDVIFIVLLIVMCSQQLQTETIGKATELTTTEAEQAIVKSDIAKTEADAIKSQYANQIQSYENADSYVTFIDVTSYYSSGAYSERTIRVLVGIEASEPVQEFKVTESNPQTGYHELQKYLEGEIEKLQTEDNDHPVILTLNRNDENILYRDELAIDNIFAQLAKVYTNVFIKYSDAE